MCKFKVGDVVKRIKGSADTHMKLGTVYTVLDCTESSTYVAVFISA